MTTADRDSALRGDTRKTNRAMWQAAVAALNGKDADGRALKVNEAKPRTEGSRGSGGRGGFGGRSGGYGGGGRRY